VNQPEWRKKIGASFLLLGFLVEASAVQITPTYQQFELKAGEKTTGELTLINTDGEDLQITPGAKDWVTTPDNKDIKAENWLLVPSRQFILKSGESRQVRFTVKAPKQATGELVAMTTFLTESENRTMVNLRVSAAVYLVIKGTEKVSGYVEAFSINPSSNNVTMGVSVVNDGNVHLRPRGSFQVWDQKNVMVANVTIDKGAPAFAGKKQGYFGELREFSFKPGKYNARINLLDVDHRYSIVSSTRDFVVNKNNEVELK
jgi:hypothetical protein